MMAKALAMNGAAKVYIVGRRLDKLQTAAKESPYDNIIPLQGDVTSKESLESIAKQVKKETGYINLLVCNSGTTGPLMEQLVPNPSLAQYVKPGNEWRAHPMEYQTCFDSPDSHFQSSC